MKNQNLKIKFTNLGVILRDPIQGVVKLVCVFDLTLLTAIASNLGGLMAVMALPTAMVLYLSGLTVEIALPLALLTVILVTVGWDARYLMERALGGPAEVE